MNYFKIFYVVVYCNVTRLNKNYLFSTVCTYKKSYFQSYIKVIMYTHFNERNKFKLSVIECTQT